MRIAIPTYGECVSPRFDCAATLVLVEPGEPKVAAPVERRFSEAGLGGRAAFLASLGVSTVLCGGIRRCDQFALERLGVVVVAGLMGPWRSLLNRYLTGQLTAETPHGPELSCGGGAPRRGRRNGHRGRPARSTT